MSTMMPLCDYPRDSPAHQCLRMRSHKNGGQTATTDCAEHLRTHEAGGCPDGRSAGSITHYAEIATSGRGRWAAYARERVAI